MSVEKLNFSIEGSFITNHFRQLCLEGEFGKAAEGLESSIIGIPKDIVYSILIGDKKLSGLNNLVLEEDNDQEYKQSLRYFLQRYAVVNGKIYEKSFIIRTICSGEDLISDRARIYDPRYDQLIVKDNCIITLRESIRYIPSKFFEFIDNESEFGTEIHVSLDTKEKEIDILRSILVYNHICREDELYEIENEDFFLEELTSRRFLKSKLIEKTEAESIDNLRSEIITQAESYGGFIKATSENGIKYSIPRNAFINWAKRQSSKRSDSIYSTIIAEWDPISKPNMKMLNDSVYHTDIVIGSGLNISNAYDKDFNSLLYSLLLCTEEDLSMLVYNGSGIIESDIVIISSELDDISEAKDKVIIIPFGGVEFLEFAKVAKLTLSKVGGPVSHLALNAGAYNINYALCKNANELEEDIIYIFDLDNGNISL